MLEPASQNWQNGVMRQPRLGTRLKALLMSYLYLMLGAFRLHLQLRLENNAGDVFPAGHYLPAPQWEV